MNLAVTKIVSNRRPIFVGVILLCVCILVWIVGPMVPPHWLDSQGSRIAVIALCLLVWIAYEGWRAWRIRAAQRRLLADADAGDRAASTKEAEDLKEIFVNATQSLKSAQFAGSSGRTALYHLPWYVLIGAPGSGKTTSLLHSGLRFPLAQPGRAAEALRGYGGTLSCDWWFTDHAVLIDTAGRFATQDSRTAVDQAAWGSFLRLLRQFRPRQPINGILVTLSVQDQFEQDEASRQLYAERMRRRVQELQEHLGLEFPIYVMVTKTDLVPGFSEFFSSFDADQRAQVWGMTFEMDAKSRRAEPARPAFEAAFPTLLMTLNDLMYQRLQEEHDVERRALIFGFPPQFATLGPRIAEFLEVAFGDSKLQANSLVRGLYFTSGTQLGAPIDRLLSRLSRALNVPVKLDVQRARHGAGKAYFITKLLKEVVFPEAPLASYSATRARTVRRMGIGALTAGALLATMLSIGMTLSFLANKEALASAKPAATQAKESLLRIGPTNADDLPAFIDALNELKRVPRAVHDPIDKPPLRMRFGLYQGREVQRAVDVGYAEALRSGLLPRVAAKLEQAVSAARTRPDDAYGPLKAYKMLYDQDLAYRQKGALWFASFVSELWAGRFPAARLDDLRAHLAALVTLKDLPAPKANQELMQSTSKLVIDDGSPVGRVYQQLLAAPIGPNADLNLTDQLGPDAVLMQRQGKQGLTTPIRAIFTRHGYYTAVRGKVRKLVDEVADEETKVLQRGGTGYGNMSRDEVAAAVERKYLQGFQEVWDGVVDEVMLRPPATLKEAQQIAQKLSRSESPLFRLIMTVDEQTQLSRGDVQPASAASGASGAPLVPAVGLNTANASETQRELERNLDDHFNTIHQLARDGGKSQDMDEIRAALKDTIAGLKAVKPGMPQVPPELDAALSQAHLTPAPAGPMIVTLAGFGREAAKGESQKASQGAAAAASVRCAQVINGRYPFARNAGAPDIGLREFALVFKLGGDLDTFFNQHLKDVVENWRFKPGQDPIVSPGSLRQYQNADAIRTAFFRDGVEPSVTADLSVLSADGEVTLDYAGTSTKMRVGGPVRRVAWPAENGARLSMGTQQIATAEGAWSLFRLVDAGRAQPNTPDDVVRVEYTAPGGGKVVLDFRSNSTLYNAFRLRELRGFSCPGK